MVDPTTQPDNTPRIGLIPDPNGSETEKILGVAAHQTNPERDEIDPKWHRFYDQLVRKRDKLIDSIREFSSKAQEVNPDPIQREPADIATESFERDEMLGSVTLDQEMLEEVNEAISRMKAGTYGLCQATGNPIPDERLEAVPWTRFTLEAEKEMEKHGDATKASIGPLGRLTERGTAAPGRWRRHEGSE